VIGHQVTVRRFRPQEDIYGVLKNLSGEWVTLWVAASHGGLTQSGNVLIPARTVVEIIDHGEVPR
jgi:hypothetical protein